MGGVARPATAIGGEDALLTKPIYDAASKQDVSYMWSGLASGAAVGGVDGLGRYRRLSDKTYQASGVSFP